MARTHHSALNGVNLDPFPILLRNNKKDTDYFFHAKKRGLPLKNIALVNKPNPQGKGLVGVLQEINSRQVPSLKSDPVSVPETLHDYAISRLILCAEFHFKPVVGQSYFLYVKSGSLKLSLISPDEWRNSAFGLYVCQCLLMPNMVWNISHKTDDREAIEQIAHAMNALKDSLLADLFLEKPLGSTLPFHDEQLPFHQRVLANALASHVSRQIPQALSKSLPQLGEENASSFTRIPLLTS